MSSGAGLTAAQERALAEDGAKAAIRTEAKKEVKHKVTTETKPKSARETTPGQRSPRDCECGCGAQTKGGRFLPGHDAKLHSRQKAEAKAAAEAAAAEAAGIQ